MSETGNPTYGRITSGIEPGASVRKTLEFVQQQLPAWRDLPERQPTEAEEDLNSQLCKFLNAAARQENFSMAYFHHEERQTGQRRVDLSALPPQSTLIEGKTYSVLEPFLVLEGKRLPAPRRNREREYVIGSDTVSGGIQRFKLGLHGAKLRYAGMIGYVQRKSCRQWFEPINRWIDELAASNDPLWSGADSLMNMAVDAETRTLRCESKHARIDSVSSQIHLTHLWVGMYGE